MCGDRTRWLCRQGENNNNPPSSFSSKFDILHNTIKLSQFSNTTISQRQSCRQLHFKSQNFKFSAQMCRLVKLKLLGRVGTFHNSPGQPPKAQKVKNWIFDLIKTTGIIRFLVKF
eukprot:sb/3476764/